MTWRGTLNPEVRAWWTDASGDTQSYPLADVPEQTEAESRGPDGYAVYIESGDDERPQVWLCDLDTLERAELITRALAVLDETAAWVLDGEDCSAFECHEDNDNEHAMSIDEAFDSVGALVDLARGAVGALQGAGWRICEWCEAERAVIANGFDEWLCATCAAKCCETCSRGLDNPDEHEGCTMVGLLPDGRAG